MLMLMHPWQTGGCQQCQRRGAACVLEACCCERREGLFCPANLPASGSPPDEVPGSELLRATDSSWLLTWSRADVIPVLASHAGAHFQYCRYLGARRGIPTGPILACPLSFVLETARGLLSAQRQAGAEGAHSAPIRFGLSPGPLGGPFGVCGLPGLVSVLLRPSRMVLKGQMGRRCFYQGSRQQGKCVGG